MSSPKFLCGLAILYALILTGCGGGGSSQPIHIPPDFTLSVTSSQAWTGGASGSSTITVSVGTVGGFTGAVDLTMSGGSFPSGVSGSFDHTTVNAPGTSTLTFTTSSSSKPANGNYTFTVVGTSGTLTHNLGAALFVPGPVKMEAIISPGAIEGPDGPAIIQYIEINAQAPVTGASFQVMWSAIDSDGSSYDWTYPDALIAPWIAAGRKANFIFWANSDNPTTTCGDPWTKNGQNGTGNCAIPSYVWTALTSSNYVNCTPPNAGGAAQRIPNYLDPAHVFQTNYQNFIKAAIAHYASTPNVGYIRFGLGRGGETLPVGDWDTQGDPCAAAFASWGLTDSTITTKWEPYLQTMLNFEAQNNPSDVQLMVGITPMNGNDVPISVAQTAVPLGIGFGSQGLEKSDVNNCANSTANWCNLFSQYTGQVPLELQTVGQSCADNSCTTGSLANLLPWAVGNKATILEIFYQDWLTAYQSNNTSYQTAITAAATGQ